MSKNKSYDNKKTPEDRKNTTLNIIEILWNTGMVYIIKFVVVLILFASVWIKTDRECLESVNLLPQLLYITPILIDCIICGRFVKDSVKGLLFLHFVFTIIILLGTAYTFLLYTDIVSICKTSIYVCDGFMILCLFSPLLELTYQVDFVLQNEEKNNI